ncbi:MAG: hypothetical protein C0504_12480 [Candidatus Solibacter sp.]|nr:hypothetical protein [Candidatus Solibacter sp.]
MNTAKAETGSSGRLVSIDQLRAYAIFGMVIVNATHIFLDPVRPTLAGSPWEEYFGLLLHQLSHHKTGFTFADSIAPLFVFVVGMAMRLSWLKRTARAHDPWAVRRSMAKRFSLLVLIAFAIYPGWLWDALMDIGLAGLLAIMLIDKRPGVRTAAAFAFVAAFQCIHGLTSYGEWSIHGRFSLSDPEYRPLLVRLLPFSEELFRVRLNGGPLGPLSWVMMLLFGANAYDLLAAGNHRKFVGACVVWGIGLCSLALLLQMEWPGVKAAWPLSARTMAAPFPLLASGLCYLQLLGFHLLCDRRGVLIPTFAAVALNPLVIYIAQHLILDVAGRFKPQRLSLAEGVAGLALFWAFFASAAWVMQKKRIYVRL